MNNFNTNYFLIILFFITSCSNDTSDNSNPEITESNIVPINLTYWESAQKFKVIDGYVEGANVFVDWNFNNIQDDGEVSAYWMGVTEPYEVCNSWDVENDTCAATMLVDPPDNYYWWIDDSVIPPQAILDELEMTKEEWLLEAFPDYGGSPTFVNTGIDNFSSDCFNNTLKIADVPIGAYDSIRGQVTKPYKLYLSYGYFNQTLKFSNITPFSTLLLKSIENANIPSDIAKACSTEWWDVITPHVDKIETLLDLMWTNLGIDRFFFFDDFIVSNDENKILQAERIVDHLSVIYDIREIIKEKNNLSVIHDRLNNETLSYILSNPNFTSVEFDLLAEEVAQDGWRKRIHYNDLNINAKGQLLLNENPIELNYENIAIASSLHSIQNVYAGSNELFDYELIDSYTTLHNSSSEREILTKKSIVYLDNYINQISNDIYNFMEKEDSLNFIISINNKSNKLIPFNVDEIVINEDQVSVNDIYQILVDLPLQWILIEDLQNLMMDGDTITIQKDFDEKTVAYMYSNTYSECIIYEETLDKMINSEIGEEAFNLCNSYFSES